MRRQASHQPGGNAHARARSVALLLMLLQHVRRLDHKPPFTLGLMGIMCGLHYQKLLTPWHFDRFSLSVTLCPDRILYRWELSRLVMSALLHGDDMHLYHNMISFLWKGYHLEHRFGPLRFATIIAILLLLSHGCIVIVSYALSKFAHMHGPLHQCSIGFSAVLFALKVLLNYGSPAITSVYGIQVPTKYAAWLELLVIHFTVPRASFLGHMCGILAGYIFVATRMDNKLFSPVIAWIKRRMNAEARSHASSPRFGRGDSSQAYGNEDDEALARRLQEEEYLAAGVPAHRFAQYEESQARNEDTYTDQQVRFRTSLTQEELRRRRLERFGQ
ncbi:hypothetical protein P43SY_011001 [Pythium insidiosum]|uniref:Peptidase S54 rhomboid domain-containing protein n=1 Tax=Pythium insidiosum TaxID=114742 RepID=A0AAD5L713_PYTIN|nr:hypothetical protein P43SY_011001 [Pythium insidiosum]